MPFRSPDVQDAFERSASPSFAFYLTLSDALLGMFEFAPTALCISTAGGDARYIKVNQAYLDLIGRSWDEIEGRSLVGAGGAVDSEARQRRMHLLDAVGNYRLDAVPMRHASGRLVPALVSALRRRVGKDVVDIEIIHDNSEIEHLKADYEARLHSAATTDPLTRLGNRSTFLQQLETAQTHVAAGDDGAALVLLNLTGFRRVNAEHGQAVGDRFLQQIADRLRAALQRDEFAARIGGDEFGLLLRLSGRDEADLQRAADRLARIFRDPVPVGRLQLVAGAAIGMAQSAADHTAETWLQTADRFMRAARTPDNRLSILWG